MRLSIKKLAKGGSTNVCRDNFKYRTGKANSLKLMISHTACAALDDYAVAWICLLTFATPRRNACSTV